MAWSRRVQPPHNRRSFSWPFAALLAVQLIHSCAFSTPYNPATGLSVENWKQGHYTFRDDSIILSVRIPAVSGIPLYELLIFNHGQRKRSLSGPGNLLQLHFEDRLIPMIRRSPAPESYPGTLLPGGSLSSKWTLEPAIDVDYAAVDFLIFSLEGAEYRIQKNYSAIWAD